MLVSAINLNRNQSIKQCSVSNRNSLNSTKNNSLNNSPSFQHAFDSHNPVDVIGLAAIIIILLRAYYNRKKGG